MTANTLSDNNSEPSGSIGASPRPRFDSKVTSDRLREGSIVSIKSSMGSSIRKGRKSVFREVGLVDDWAEDRQNSFDVSDEKEFGEITGIISEEPEELEEPDEPEEPTSPTGTHGDTTGDSDSKRKARWLSKLAQVKRPKIKEAASSPPPTMASLHRLTTIALLIAIVLPAVSYNSGRKKVDMSGADAGVIRSVPDIILEDRANSPVDVCLRWAQQCKYSLLQQCHQYSLF